MINWVVCRGNSGYLVNNGLRERRKTAFDKDAIGQVKNIQGEEYEVWLIGCNQTFLVPSNEVEYIDITQTGDRFNYKICNVCHCLKPIANFDKNQNNKRGVVRRPSCTKCRSDIDKRAPKSSQAKEMEKLKPQLGEPFSCPICKKRSIAYVTAKIVADHEHHTGNIRDYICDSCNTGLGRFKNGQNYLMNAVEYIRDRDVLGH